MAVRRDAVGGVTEAVCFFKVVESIVLLSIDLWESKRGTWFGVKLICELTMELLDICMGCGNG